MADLVIVAHFLERSEALIARALLDSEGVFAVLPDFNALGVEPGFAFTQGGFRLMASADDLETARTILRDAQMSANLTETG